MVWCTPALCALLLAAAALCVGCSLSDGLDEAGPVIAKPSTLQLSSSPLGPLAGAYSVAPQPGLSPTQTYENFHAAVTARDTAGCYTYLSSKTRDRLAQVGLAMSVTDVPALIENLLKDPAFAAFAPDESIQSIDAGAERTTITTRKGNTVAMVMEDGCWRFDF